MHMASQATYIGKIMALCEGIITKWFVLLMKDVPSHCSLFGREMHGLQRQ